MNRFFTLLLAAFCLTAVGQCEADYDFGEANWGISLDPTLGEIFPTASLNQPYSGSLHILVPTLMNQVDDIYPTGTSVVQMELIENTFVGATPYGLVFKDLVTMEQFHAEDLGFAFVPNNNGDDPDPNVLLPGGQYCAEIEGVPTRQGVYELEIDLIFRFTPFGITNYNTIDRVGGIVLSVQGVEPECGSDLNSNGICDLEELENAASGGLCGQGTIWDEATQLCLPLANPSDLNLDGCVDVQDFMGHLAAFGEGCNGNPQTSLWQCGDPLEYQGYDYQTVQIGEQCWFAENLRAQALQTGEEVPYANGAGSLPLSPAHFTQPYPGYVDSFGLLYNAYTFQLNDICPSGWDIPDDSDWIELRDYAGGQEIAGNRLKAQGNEFWQDGNQGTDEFNFSVRGGGWIFGSYSEYLTGARFWSQDNDCSNCADGCSNVWDFGYNYPGFGAFSNCIGSYYAASIRCIKDSE